MRERRLTPFYIKGTCFKNPFAILAEMPLIPKAGGKVVPATLAYYRVQAQAEAALVIVGPASAVPPPLGRTCLRADQPKYMDGLRALVKVIESGGAVAGIQLIDPCPCEDPDQRWDRVQNAFRVNTKRLHEIGFHYLEVDLAGSGALRWAIEHDQGQRMREFFSQWLQDLPPDLIGAIRFDHHLPAWPAENFLAAGGDLVALSDQASDKPFPSNQTLIQLTGKPTPDHIVKWLKYGALIGLPAKRI
ncbi:MAG: hypothetical protein H6510_01130 [Acidobacteria bacterium]|nr:hypothetical protein [Acidobacteriota bacterium]MCB9396392.1 hypothetical protein [Acidobacteriota bacterium]